jgi:hypothetical protein
MKKINLILITTILLGLVFSASFSYSAEEKDQEVKLVNRTVTIVTTESARDDMKPVVDPVNLNSTPGTTVIWVNFSKTPVELLFLDKKVTTACGSPVNFFVGKNGAYESAKIPFGGTASLCFLEKGKFEYMVNTSSTFYPSKMKEQRGFIWIE